MASYRSVISKHKKKRVLPCIITGKLLLGMIAGFLWISSGCGSMRNVVDESAATHHISPLLMIDADAVIRSDVRRFELQSRNSGRLHVHRRITVLNPDGRRHTRLRIPYNPFREIRNIRGQVFDRHGNRVGVLRRRDVGDHAMVTAMYTYTDYRYKDIQLRHDRYPYTVEYEYTMDYSHLLVWPEWTPQPSGTALEFGQFILDMKDDIPYRSKTRHVNEVADDSTGNIIWKIENRNRIRSREMGPGYHTLQPELRLAGHFFDVDGYPGSMSDWSDFAAWYYSLYKDRMALPPSDVKLVETLVNRIDDTTELVQELYRHVQQTTRYVNISLGIGGWRPHPPEYVYQNRYGECKALTHYLLALLHEAGVEAHPVLVQAGGGSSSVLPDFPENRFNHVFLAVPLTMDTLWIEATSHTLPAGYAGKSNSNRYGLLVRENGGELIRIPDLKASENRISRKAEIFLDENGDADATLTWNAFGYEHEVLRHAHQSLRGREQRHLLDRLVNWPHARIGDFSLDSQPNDPVASLHTTLHLPQFSNRSGDRLFITPPPPPSRLPSVPESADYPLQLSHAYTFTDTLIIHVPQHFQVTSLPDSQVLEEPFGRYETHWKQISQTDDQSQVMYIRNIEMAQSEIPPDQIPGFIEFRREIRRFEGIPLLALLAAS